MSVVLMSASGSVDSPLCSTLPEGVSFGHFGLPHPGEIKVPANAARDGFNVLVVDVFVLRTGLAASVPVSAWFGPRGSTADPAPPAISIGPVANPNQAHIRWSITFGPATAYAFTEAWVNNVGNSNGSRELTFDPSVDNYFTIGTSSLNAADTLALISITARLDGAAPADGINLVTAPFTVDPAFFGINSQDWPSRAGTSGGAAPTFPVGRISTYDCNQCHWRTLHLAEDTFDWSHLDRFVAGARERGIARGTYVLYGCPQFLATTGVNVIGPYSGLGEGAAPASLGQLAQFCARFAARNRTLYFGFFDYVQLFNEPDFDQTPSKQSFWWGSAGQYVDMLWTAFAALRFADPCLTIGSPGTFDVDGMRQWLAAPGARFITVHGADCFDVVSAHPYHARPMGYPGMGDVYGLEHGGIRDFEALLAPYGKTQIAVTEYGVSSKADEEVAAFNAAPADYRRIFVQRILIDWLLAGVRFACVFSLGNAANLISNIDSVPLSGLPPDDEGTKRALADLYDAAAGKTVVAGGRQADGTRLLAFSDNTRYVI